jgi:type IV secretory pathway VirB4 component
LGWLPARLKKYTDKIVKGSEEALKMGANLNNLKNFAKGAEKLSLKKKLQNCKKSWQDLRNHTKKMLDKVKGQKNENKIVHKIRLSSYNPSTAINMPRESR